MLVWAQLSFLVISACVSVIICLINIFTSFFIILVSSCFIYHLSQNHLFLPSAHDSWAAVTSLFPLWGISKVLSDLIFSYLLSLLRIQLSYKLDRYISWSLYLLQFCNFPSGIRYLWNEWHYADTDPVLIGTSIFSSNNTSQSFHPFYQHLRCFVWTLHFAAPLLRP